MKTLRASSQNSTTKYAAFLRGINVGGNKIIKMEDLKHIFQAIGFQNVTTILASGNVLFETTKTEAAALGAQIAAQLKSTLGHEIGVLIRSVEELQRLADLKPFGKVKVTPETRLYVTFVSQAPKTLLKVPFKSPDKDFQVLHASNDEVCTVVTLTPSTQSTDLMGFLEKHFGKKITTRNWNTIAKILSQ